MKFMDALGSNDEEALRKVTEKKFADKIITEMPHFKDKELKYTKQENINPDSFYIIDKIFLKGVASDRSKNGSNFDYEVISENE